MSNDKLTLVVDQSIKTTADIDICLSFNIFCAIHKKQLCLI